MAFVFWAAEFFICTALDHCPGPSHRTLPSRRLGDDRHQLN
jgi:hypothetical protein